MKILAFVDTHGSMKSLKKVMKKAKKADIVVCAGDLSIFEEGLDIIIMELNSLKKPVLLIHLCLAHHRFACSSPLCLLPSALLNRQLLYSSVL